MRPILEEHGIEIVEAFEDEGISGVDAVEKRPEFSRMQRMAQTGTHKTQRVTCILCYDISRWGRFRDPLDSIAYMQDFKRAGLPIYFTDDKYVKFAADTQQAANGILMVLGSMEATGYSEERSKLTTRGLNSVAKDGYWTGGQAPYGMVRVLLDKDGNPTCVLGNGEQKAVKEQRVKLAPGPVEQVRIVQEIFDLKAQGWGYMRIARNLNEKSIPAPRIEQWTPSSILKICRNNAYVGDRAFEKRNISKFNSRDGALIWRPESEWVRKPNAWDGIISRDVWEQVQQRLGNPSGREKRNPEYWLSGLIRCVN